MLLASWSVEDRLPYLPGPTGLYVEPGEDTAEVALLSSLPEDAVRRRIDLENRPYIARLDGDPVAVGWVAAGVAHIGELGLSFRLPQADRFLWGVEVLRPCRGQDIHARLLEGIILTEEASRFWVTYSPDDLAAVRGLEAIGFNDVGELSYRSGVGAVLEPTGPIERALEAASMMGAKLAGHGAVGGGSWPRIAGVPAAPARRCVSTDIWRPTRRSPPAMPRQMARS